MPIPYLGDRCCFTLVCQARRKEPRPDVPAGLKKFIVRRWRAPVIDRVRKVQSGVTAYEVLRHPGRVIARQGT